MPLQLDRVAAFAGIPHIPGKREVRRLLKIGGGDEGLFATLTQSISRHFIAADSKHLATLHWELPSSISKRQGLTVLPRRQGLDLVAIFINTFSRSRRNGQDRVGCISQPG